MTFHGIARSCSEDQTGKFNLAVTLEDTTILLSYLAHDHKGNFTLSPITDDTGAGKVLTGSPISPFYDNVVMI